MILLAKYKSNTIKVIVYKALIDLHTSHDELVLINNVRKECDNKIEEIKNFISSSSKILIYL